MIAAENVVISGNDDMNDPEAITTLVKKPGINESKKTKTKNAVNNKRKSNTRVQIPEFKPDMTYYDYYKNNEIMYPLNKYKLTDLKKIAKHNNLKVTANKPTLVSRIHNFFICNMCITKIQSVLRRFFVKRMFNLRGPGYLNRSLCVNESDFYTLEPLNEIPKQEFFSYQDEKGFIYGFNVNSLIHLLKIKETEMNNPYNRDKIPEIQVGNIIRLYLYMILYFPENVDQEDLTASPYLRNRYLQPVLLYKFIDGGYFGFPRRITHMSQIVSPQPLYQRRRVLPPTIQVVNEENLNAPQPRRLANNQFFRRTTTNDIFDSDNDNDDESFTISRNNSSDSLFNTNRTSQIENDGITNLITAFENINLENRVITNQIQQENQLERPIMITSQLPRSPTPSTGAILRRDDSLTQTNLDHIEDIRRKIQNIRNNPLSTRIQELFMEIDQLGNYTQVRWFNELTKRRCFILYGHLFENWRYRSHLLPHVKSRICPLGDPFYNIMPLTMTIDDVSEVQLRTGCVTVMENMIYTGYDIEDRRLGALHVLTALTAVSLGARDTLPWLYESMY